MTPTAACQACRADCPECAKRDEAEQARPVAFVEAAEFPHRLWWQCYRARGRASLYRRWALTATAIAIIEAVALVCR